MGFELFTGRKGRMSEANDLYVRITKSANIGFNNRVKNDVIKGKKNVHVYYDADFKRIGFKFLATGDACTYNIANKNFYFNPTAFFKTYKINTSLFHGSHKATYDKNTEMLIVNLDEIHKAKK